MRVPGRAAAWSLLLLSLGPLSCARTRDYPVRLDRPWVAGHRYALKGFVLHQAAEKRRGPRPAIGNKMLNLDLVVQPQVISPRGNLRRVEISVRQLAYLGRRATVLLAPGDLVSAVLDARPGAFMIRGVPVSPAAEEELRYLFPYRGDDEPSDDDAYGSPPLREAGESWPIHRDLAAKARPFGLLLDGKDIEGRVRLRRLRTIDGRAWGEFQLRERGRNATLDRRLSPDGIDTEVPAFMAEVTTDLPLDPKVESGRTQRIVQSHIVMRSQADDGSQSRQEKTLRDITHLRWDVIP
jgi:hypothetical protein